MGPYERFIALSRYARWLPEENRRETWEETVKRYTDWIGYKEFYDPIVNLEVMPSMRAMMTAGPAGDRDNTCVFNCSFISVDDPKSFDEAMFVLLCGTGVGFSVERQYIQKLPEIPEKLFDSETTIVVRDSKEGWAKAFRQLLAMLWAGEVPKWDVSRVRPAGSPLKTFGGRASGPEPLEDLFRFTVTTFRKAAGRKLTSIECHDIMCKVGEIVVVGGVRRSALISLSNLSDDRMRHAKSGQWWIEHGHRALANNSVSYSDKPDIESFMREWLALMESKSGERGIYNREAAVKQAAKNGRRDTNYEFGTNPCCFIGSQKLLTEEGYKTFSELSCMESVRTVSSDGSVSDGKVWSSGNKEVIKLYFADGTEITCTPDHEFQLSSGDVCEAAFLLGKSVKGYEKDSSVVYKIEPAGVQEVFDFTEPSNHWGVVDGFVAHNSEIILRPQQFCNLSEAVIRKDDTKEDIERKVRLAAALGTIQSQYTKFPYLRRIWKKNTEEERLLGVSMTGIMDNEITAYPEPEFLESLR